MFRKNGVDSRCRHELSPVKCCIVEGGGVMRDSQLANSLLASLPPVEFVSWSILRASAPLTVGPQRVNTDTRRAERTRAEEEGRKYSGGAMGAERGCVNS